MTIRLISLALLLLLSHAIAHATLLPQPACTSIVADPASDEKPQLLGGQWTGNYWDAAGANASLTMSITVDGSTFSGTCTVNPVDIHGSRGFEVPVSGSVSGDTVTFRVTIGRPAQEFTFTGTIRDADPYALQSMFGLVAGGPGMPRAGVWIMWRPAE